jgi:hypothetical protein
MRANGKIRFALWNITIAANVCKHKTYVDFLFLKARQGKYIYIYIYIYIYRVCGLVVRVPGYRSRGPGSIPGATRFSEKLWVWNGAHSAS